MFGTRADRWAEERGDASRSVVCFRLNFVHTFSARFNDLTSHLCLTLSYYSSGRKFLTCPTRLAFFSFPLLLSRSQPVRPHPKRPPSNPFLLPPEEELSPSSSDVPSTLFPLQIRRSPSTFLLWSKCRGIVVGRSPATFFHRRELVS